MATGIWIELAPAVVASGETRTAGSELLTVTVTPPWFEAPSVKLVLVCSPLPTVTAPTEMVGRGLTVTKTLSGCRLGAVATTYVVHGNPGAEPP